MQTGASISTRCWTTVVAELEIWINGRQVGILDGSDRRNLRLVYDNQWVERSGSTPLSVSLPLAAKTHSGKGVSAYLWGLLPDNNRVLERWAATYQCSATDVFGMLQGVGSDVAGAAQYLLPGTHTDEVSRGKFKPLTDGDVAELLRNLQVDTTAWHPMERGRWSLAGAQAKIALAYDDQTRTWGIPSGIQPTTHILKPAVTGLDHHDLNEHLCLSAAGRLGLRVAKTQILRLQGERALVVTRYDRAYRDGEVRRIHQEDCCQALGVHPELKYQSDGGPGIEDIAQLLRGVEIRNAQDDVYSLVRAAAFNWLILGTDAHAKNYSLLLSARQVRLAPLYDIASAAPYGDHPKKLKLAQKIGGEYRPTVISRRHWDRLAKAVQVDADRLHVDIVEMATNLSDALLAAISETELTASELAAANLLVDQVSTWAVGCIRAMEVG